MDKSTWKEDDSRKTYYVRTYMIMIHKYVNSARQEDMHYWFQISAYIVVKHISWHDCFKKNDDGLCILVFQESRYSSRRISNAAFYLEAHNSGKWNKFSP